MNICIPHICIPYIYSFTEKCLGYFQLLAIVNNIVMNMCAHIYAQFPDFNSFRYALRNGIDRTYVLKLYS